jgi:hypothetical protein
MALHDHDPLIKPPWHAKVFFNPWGARETETVGLAQFQQSFPFHKRTRNHDSVQHNVHEW